MHLNFVILVIHALLLYGWVLFPALLFYFSRRRTAPEYDYDESAAPAVTVVLSAYNEEDNIAARIRNLRRLDYPQERLRVLIGIDGSQDDTAEEARAAAAGARNIMILEFPENRGKVAVLRDLVARAQQDGGDGEILIFTDANSKFAPDALQRLIAPFADPGIGAVCGKLLFVRPERGSTEENVYWRLENWLKAKESVIDSCLGANGAIYAIRSPLFWSAIPSNTVIDDFVIAMKVREQNFRIIYEPRALATEALPSKVHHEWTRRVRIGAGDFQALRLCRACLKPSFGSFAWIFWSHKVLRWFTPHLILAGSLLVIRASAKPGERLGWLFLAVYGAVGAAMLLGRRSGLRKGYAPKLFRACHYMVILQAAIFAGFLRFCRGNLEGRWQRTARE
jgi:cellulose synthase/poly-beta-1,6-N-acetylglucosamine synthase-like glycosyltransferase